MNQLLVFVAIFFLASITFSHEPQSPSDSEPWIVIDPLAAEDKYDSAKAQFSNDPNFLTYVEGRVNARHPDRRFAGPYVEGVSDNYYKYARTKQSWMVGWVRVILYWGEPKVIGGKIYYPYHTVSKEWPSNSEQLQVEVKRYFDDQFQEQKKRYEARVIAEDYKRQQDGLKRKKSALKKELAEIDSQIEN